MSVATVILAALLVSLQLAVAARGVGLWDEGYVLSLIVDPQESVLVGEPYLFGFLVHPLAQILGNDLTYLRWASIALLVVSSWVLASVALRTVGDRTGGRLSWRLRLPVESAVAASSTLAVALGSRVLEYRGVAILGLIWTTIGLLTILRRRVLLGGWLVGLGLWVCFCGKPTTAAAAVLALVLCTGSTFLHCWRRALPAMVAGLLTGLLWTCVSAGLTPMGLISYLGSGYRAVQLLRDHSSLAVMVGLTAQPIRAIIVGVIPVLPLILGAIAIRKVGPKHREWVWSASALSALLISLVLGQTIPAFDPATDIPMVVSPMLMVIPLGVLLALSWGRPPKPTTRTLVLMLVLPYSLAVGSNMWFTEQMPYAGVFWVAAACLFTVPRSASFAPPRLAVPAAFGCVLLVALVESLVLLGGPLGQDVAHATVATQTRMGRVLVPPDDAAVLKSFAGLRGEGLTEQTPVADLTGLAHGFRFFLGGRPLGRAATFGAFPGAVDAARYAMSKEPCSAWAHAWVLYSAHNDYGVEQVFTERGLDITRDYELMGEFGFVQGGFTPLRTMTVQVLRPRESVGLTLGCPST